MRVWLVTSFQAAERNTRNPCFKKPNATKGSHEDGDVLWKFVHEKGFVALDVRSNEAVAYASLIMMRLR